MEGTTCDVMDRKWFEAVSPHCFWQIFYAVNWKIFVCAAIKRPNGINDCCSSFDFDLISFDARRTFA
jgi:hypothetical protein